MDHIIQGKSSQVLSHDDDKKSLMEIGACVASTFEKMKWNAQGKGVNCRAFYFTSYRCVEECMTGFRIYGRTIKRGKFVCILVI